MSARKNKKTAVAQWKRTVISSAVALVISGVYAAPAWSAPCAGSISTIITGGCDATGVTPLTITSSGQVNISASTALYYYGPLAGSLTNNGSITAGTALTTYALGVYVSTDLSGALINSGTISATSHVTTSWSNAYATGIYIGNNLSGTLTNSGTINATALTSNTGSDAYARGIYVSNALTGTLTNSGTINVTSTSTRSDAYGATGIYVGSVGTTGVLNNTGTINVTATANSSANTGYGMYISGDMDGALTNSGTINVTAISTRTGYASNNGLYIGGNVNGSLTNSGTISATATSGYYAWTAGIDMGSLNGTLTNTSTGKILAIANAGTGSAYATGIAMGSIGSTGKLTNNGTISASAISTRSGASAYGVTTSSIDLGGTLSNTGTISASAKGSRWASAYGVEAWGGIAGTLNNSGTISATAISTRSSASAYGVAVWNNGLSGTLTNTGTISASAKGSSSASAYGAVLGGGIAGTLNNSGTISATATGTHGGASAYGIYSWGTTNGTLINSGTISAAAKGSSWVSAYGVDLSGLGAAGVLTNSGSITASAISTRSSASATGVYIGTLDGKLTNSGTISATANGVSWVGAYGIEGGNLGAAAVLTNTGKITASATGDSGSAYGIAFWGPSAINSLTNTGTISATAKANAWWASAYGISANNGVSGALLNTGTISATANARTWAGAYGIDMGWAWTSGGTLRNDTSGTLTNSGTITASAAGSSASAYGIYSQGGISGALDNGGTISATASGSRSYASAYGLSFRGGINTLTNSGSISATATGVSWTRAYGMDLRGGFSCINWCMNFYTKSADLSGALTNSGTISASATAAGSGASAYGVYLEGSVLNTATLSNSGSISASAKGTSWVSAYGVYVGNSVDVGGALSNSGTISASAISTRSSGSATGVYIGTLNGTLTNSGTISGVASGTPANGYSIYTNGGAGSIDNQAGGVLIGNLYANNSGNFSNAGDIYLPTGSSAYIGGNYTQAATGMLSLGAASTTNYAQLTVNGTADITGSNPIAVRASVNNTLNAGDVLADVLLSTGGLNLVDGATVNVIGTPFFTYTGVVDGETIDITVASEGNFSSVLGALGNSSLVGVAGTLDALVGGYTGTGAMDPLLDALYGMNTTTELSNATQQLLPLMTASMGLVTTGVLRDTNRIIQARQDANRGLSSGDAFSGDRKLWLKPFGSLADQGDRKSVPGYEAKTYGLAVGADAEISNATRIGAAFVYADSNVDGNSSVARQSADIKSYRGIFYGSYSMDKRTDVNFQADYGVHQNKGKRNLTIPAPAVASSDYSSQSVHLGAGVGRSYDISPKTTFTPSVRADYTRIRADGYTETGAGALNLTVSGNTTDELIFSVDGKVSYALSDSTRFTANLGIGYDALSERASVTSTFVGGGPAFTTQGLDPSPLLVRGGLGWAVTSSKAMEITARYDVEARQDFTNQTASFKLRMPF